MINLYQILNIEPKASIKSIQAGIAIYSLRSDANPKVVQAARQYLLNPQHRQAYDHQLFAALGWDTQTNQATAVPIKPPATHHIDKKLIPTQQMADFEHFYQFLGISTQANYAEIADAIDEAVLEGLNGKHIQAARETLLNPALRAAYDAEHQIDSAAAILSQHDTQSVLKQRGFSIKNWWQRRRNPASVPADIPLPSVDNVTAQAKKVTHILTESSDTATLEAIESNNPKHPTTTLKTESTQAQPTPLPTFKRDNWYQFLGIRGDATYQEIKVALRTAKLKGRDKELIKQAQNILLRPATRRLYDKQNNIAIFVAAQNGNIRSKVTPTDYRVAKQWLGYSSQKLLLGLLALIALGSGFLPWLSNVAGLRFMLAWPVFITSLFTLACVLVGHKQDPLYRQTHIYLSLSLIPAAWLLSLVTWRTYQSGLHIGGSAAVAMVVVSWLWRAQSRNVSFQASKQQWLALFALFINLIWAGICWYQWSQHG